MGTEHIDESADVCLHFSGHVTSQVLKEYSVFVGIRAACTSFSPYTLIVYNTTKTVCMVVRPKKSLGRYSTRVSLGNKELSFVEEFRYLGHVMTADCRDDKDIKKQFMWQNAVGNMLVRKFSFAPIEAKIQLFKSYC